MTDLNPGMAWMTRATSAQLGRTAHALEYQEHESLVVIGNSELKSIGVDPRKFAVLEFEVEIFVRLVVTSSWLV